MSWQMFSPDLHFFENPNFKASFFENSTVNFQTYAELMVNADIEKLQFAFEKFTVFSSKFSTIALGVKIAANLWADSQEKKRHEEQVKWLRAMHKELVEINENTRNILLTLQDFVRKFPIILEKELKQNELNKKWSILNTEFDKFRHAIKETDYTVKREKYENELKESINFICDHEYRYEKLLAIPEILTFLNIISAGQEWVPNKSKDYIVDEEGGGFIMGQLIDVDKRLHGLQLQLLGGIAKLSDDYIKDLTQGFSDEYTNFVFDGVKGPSYIPLNITIHNSEKSIDQWEFEYGWIKGDVGGLLWQDKINTISTIFRNKFPEVQKTYKEEVKSHSDAFKAYSMIRKQFSECSKVDFETITEGNLKYIV